MDDTFRRVEEHLRPWARSTPITLDTELYRDLGMCGDDLAFDVVLWATREFGVEGVFPLFNYAPGERPFRPMWRFLRKRIGWKDRARYKSFAVRDLISAIDAKRWPAD